MKRTWTILVGAALLVAGFAIGEAAAAQKAGSTDFSLMVGGHRFEGDQNIEDDWTFGLGVAHNYTKNLGIELTLNYTPTQTESLLNDFDVDAWVYKADLLYNFPATDFFPNFSLPYISDIVPYVAAGLGGITLDPDNGSSETDFLVNYGAGVKLFVTENVAIRGDVRHLYVFDDPDNNLLFSAGLLYQLGGVEPAPMVRAAAPMDSDNDGVLDSDDRCPGTPQGTPVDRFGCPEKPAPAATAVVTDSDGDGVPDSRDACPGTPRGVIVDDKGCTLSMEIHIEFPFDSAEIPATYKDELKKAAQFIQENPAPKILVAGHTDSIGEAEYNQKLSERRAAAVRQYLIDNYNISRDKLVARGYGESRPIATNETSAGRQQNRRTEIVCCVVIPED